MPVKNLSLMFCEDVRHEVGEKVSYMGVLGTVLRSESAPLNLPRFFIAISAEIYNERKIDVVIALSSTNGLALPPKIETSSENEQESWTIRLNLGTTDFLVNEAGSLTCNLTIGDQSLSSTLQFDFID